MYYVISMSNQLINNNNYTSDTFTTNDFNEETTITRENFPTAVQFKQLYYNTHFNPVLDMIKHKLLDAIAHKQTSVLIMFSEISDCPDDIVDDIRSFLIEQGYRISEIEGYANISQGWELTW